MYRVQEKNIICQPQNKSKISKKHYHVKYQKQFTIFQFIVARSKIKPEFNRLRNILKQRSIMYQINIFTYFTIFTETTSWQKIAHDQNRKQQTNIFILSPLVLHFDWLHSEYFCIQYLNLWTRPSFECNVLLVQKRKRLNYSSI